MATIDLTGRYFRARYMRGGTTAWTLDRASSPVRAIVVHHSAGFYGAALGLEATQAQEVGQLDSMAADHRDRFGIGPGYHYVAFPSGRLYAVGKVGTHRAHTKGRRPATGERWNVDAIGVCAMGNYDAGVPSQPLLSVITDAIAAAVAEVRGFAFAGSPQIAAFAHGLSPTLNAAGSPFSQGTVCPGRQLVPLALSLNPAEPGLDVTALCAELTAIREAVGTIGRLISAA